MSAQPIPLTERRKRRAGLILYTLGLLLGLILALLTIWGDLEAFLFDTLFRPERTLTSLSCPVLITADEETAVIKATLKNDSERDENLLVRAHISLGRASLIREEEVRLTLPPGGEEMLEWPIQAEDAAWNRIVLARVGTVRNQPYRQLVGAACGVLLVPVKGVTGGQIFVFILVAGLFLLILGAWLWGVGRRPLDFEEIKSWRLMVVFAGLTGIALLVSFLKFWLLGLLAILLILLLLVNFISS